MNKIYTKSFRNMILIKTLKTGGVVDDRKHIHL